MKLYDLNNEQILSDSFTWVQPYLRKDEEGDTKHVSPEDGLIRYNEYLSETKGGHWIEVSKGGNWFPIQISKSRTIYELIYQTCEGVTVKVFTLSFEDLKDRCIRLLAEAEVENIEIKKHKENIEVASR